MSEFDPQQLNLTRYQRFMRRFCPERHLMLRADGVIHSFTLRSWHQVVASIVAVVLFGWMAYATATIVWLDDIVAAKDQRIVDARDAYKSLLAQVSVYKAKVAEVTVSLKDNHRQFSQLVDPTAPIVAVDAAKAGDGTGTEAVATGADVGVGLSGGQMDGALSRMVAQRRVDRERQTLLAQLDTLEQGMSDLTKARLLLTEFDAIELEMRKVVLQRDLAIAENSEMAIRVKELEDNLLDMKQAQLTLVDRFGAVAEEHASSIEETLAGTGLNIEDLLEQMGTPSDSTDQSHTIDPATGAGEEAADYGKGGPYLPITLPNVTVEGLDNRLDVLNASVVRWTSLVDLARELPLAKPVVNYRLTSGFGQRRDPFHGRLSMHEGLDFAGPRGEPVMTTASGVVTFAGWRSGFGRLVEVDHGNGITTRYAHMNSIAVAEGETVDRLDPVGSLGSSGRSTGVHLHYEVRVHGRALNPMKFLKAGEHVFEIQQ